MSNQSKRCAKLYHYICDLQIKLKIKSRFRDGKILSYDQAKNTHRAIIYLKNRVVIKNEMISNKKENAQ